MTLLTFEEQVFLQTNGKPKENDLLKNRNSQENFLQSVTMAPLVSDMKNTITEHQTTNETMDLSMRIEHTDTNNNASR